MQILIKFQAILEWQNLFQKKILKLYAQLVKVRKLKSLRTQVPRVNRPKPETNIIKAATLYLVASDPLLSKKVSCAKDAVWGIALGVVFFLDENIFFSFLLIQINGNSHQPRRIPKRQLILKQQNAMKV